MRELNSNDKKMSILGAFVVFIALIGSTLGSSGVVPVEAETHTYTLLWTDLSGRLDDIKDSTKENSDTESQFVIQEANVISVTVKFSYVDDYPGPGGAYNDEFTISLTAPTGEEKSASVDSSGTAELEFQFKGPQRNKTVKAESREEAVKQVEDEFYTLDGTGNYTLKVTAGSCPGRRPGLINLGADRDRGNDWTVEVSYKYYTISVSSPTNSKVVV